MQKILQNSALWILPGLLTGLILFFQTARGQVPGQADTPVFEFAWSNDFFNQTDRYFSNGFDVAFYHPFMEHAPSRVTLLPDKWAEKVYHGVTLTQHVFTPDRLFESTIDLNDRPYASYLLLGHRKVAFNSYTRLRLQTEFQVGILGRYSGGETLQNGIHDLLPASRTAIGWDNQLEPDPAMNYSLHIEKGVAASQGIQVIPHAGFRAGIPYTDVEAGLQIRAGKVSDYFSNLGLLYHKGFSYYFLVDVSGRYVAYNATLQGGLLNESPHTLKTINPLVSQVEVGFGFAVKHFTVEYRQYFISPEFRDGLAHKWGMVTFQLSL